VALQRQLRQTSQPNLLNKISRFWLKGPAFAGLFFVLSAGTGGFPPGASRLSAAGQQYFRAFIDVFTPLVLKREKKPGGNARWGDKNRDCAGLVRYLFWEALQAHGETFFDAYPQTRGLNPGDRRGFKGVAEFWSRGNYTAPDLIRQARPLGRGVVASALKTGDLLYFNSAELKIRHVMLVIRAERDIFLVYHTGDVRNELRIRTLADIAALAETEWHPDSGNPVFQGFFRPVFLD